MSVSEMEEELAAKKADFAGKKAAGAGRDRGCALALDDRRRAERGARMGQRPRPASDFGRARGGAVLRPGARQ
jgi:hypothetical protein